MIVQKGGRVTNPIIVVKMPCKLLYVIQVKGFLIKCSASLPYLVSEVLIAYNHCGLLLEKCLVPLWTFKKGWIYYKLFDVWFNNHFCIMLQLQGQFYLCMLDDHSSHYCPDKIRLAAKHQVILFTLPPILTICLSHSTKDALVL